MDDQVLIISDRPGWCVNTLLFDIATRLRAPEAGTGVPSYRQRAIDRAAQARAARRALLARVDTIKQRLG